MPKVKSPAVILGAAFISIVLFIITLFLLESTCPPRNTNLEWDTCIVRW